jgi:3-phenylpropionate/trans-cinnamate dioxygenase ferredoxin reductase subunit
VTDPAGPLPDDGVAVVVGASLAGLRAAETLRAEGHRGRIVLVGEEDHPPYDRPPLSKQVLAGTWPPERATLADEARLAAQGLEARLGCRAVGLDAEARRVSLDDGTVIDADGVVVATGCRARHLPGTGPGVHVVRTLEDSAGLRAELLAGGPGTRVVVVGAGFIGSEVASTCQGLGCRVTVVEAAPTPLALALGEQVGAACGALHGRHGTELLTGVGVAAVRAPGPGQPGAVVLADGRELAADVVVVGIGVAPNVEWLEGSGLTLGNGVLVDQALFAADRVVAAGDLARFPHSAYGEVRIEHWQMAAELGVAAGRSLRAGRADAPAFDTVPYFWSDQYGMKFQLLGHPSPDDEVVVVDGALDGERFVALYGSAGRLTAAVALSRPRQLMAYRPLLSAGATLDEARALAVG